MLETLSQEEAKLNPKDLEWVHKLGTQAAKKGVEQLSLRQREVIENIYERHTASKAEPGENAGEGKGGKRKHVTIYTDGSSRGNPGPGGYGTVLLFGKYRKELSEGFRCTTNNRMELMAAIAGLEALRETCEVTIYTDSKYVAKAFQDHWIEGWKRRGWKKSNKEPVKNRDLWERLDALNAKHHIHWKWVRGHAGNRENERCDVLATEAADGNGKREDPGFRAAL